MVTQLRKAYQKVTALRDVDLTVGPGMFGLLGPNGAGKTTLMKILATLIPPTGGSATVLGRDVSREPEAVRSLIGYLPQEFGIYQRLTGREFLDYVACLKGLGPARARRRQVDRLLEQVSLTEAAGRRVGTYSGGMRQRLGIAQALLGEPPALIIDEPTAGLDPAERIRFRNLLAELSSDRIIILSTHIVGDVERSCERLALLNRGEVRFTGTPSEFCRLSRGKVWEVACDEGGFAALKPKVRVVSTRRTDSGLSARVIAVEAPPGGTPAESTLEDSYMYLVVGDAL